MSIFGQVWLWSLLAFVVGALLTWLVLVLPARKRIRELESDLATAHAEAARVPANAGALAAGAGGTSYLAQVPLDDEPEFTPAASYSATVTEQRPVEQYEETVVEKPVYFETDSDPDYPETVIEQAREQAWAEAEAETPAEPEPTRMFESEAEYDDGHQAAAEPEDPYRAAATQYLSPVSDLGPIAAEDEPEYADPEPQASEAAYAEPEHVPATYGELPEHEQVSADEHRFDTQAEYEPEQPYRSSLEARLDPGPETQPELPEHPVYDEPEPVSLFQPSSRRDPVPDPDWFDHEPLPERSPFEEPSSGGYFGEHAAPEHVEPEPRSEPEPEPEPAYAFGGDEIEDSVPESPAETTQLLPKRQPRESPRGGFEPPRPIEPSMRAVERREPSSDLSGGHSGSLFEPSVQPNQPPVAPPAAPEPPPARHASADAVPPGPFGPGSAMPRPGGGRPADEFEVKASVTALRYCTEDSPQFPRMVAEVWFRTATDAERVGFRPLS